MLNFYVEKIKIFYLVIGLRNEIVVRNQKLVYSIGNKWVNGRSIDYKDDLFQEGFTQLIKSVERYDPSKAALSTYSYIRIKGGIIHYWRDKANTFKGADKVPPLSMDFMADDSRQNYLHSSITRDPQDDLYRECDRRLLIDKIGNLEGDNKKIFSGLLEGRTQKDIAKEMQITTGAISDKVKRGIELLRREVA